MKRPTILQSPRLKKWSLRLVIATLLFWMAGFFILPYAAKPLLEKLLQDKYHRQVSIGDISINPVILAARVKQIAMLEPDGKTPFLTARELYVNLQARSLIQGAPIIEELKLVQPYLHMVRTAANTYNLSDIVADMLKPTDTKTLFSLNNIEVSNGRIDFDDQPEQSHHVVSELNVRVPFISNLPYKSDTYVTPLLSAKVNGASLTLSGRSQPFSASRETVIDLKLSGVDLAKYMEYVPEKLSFSVPSAQLDTNLTVSFAETAQQQPTVIIRGSASLSKLRVVQAGNTLLSLNRLSAIVDNADIFGGHIKLKSLTIDAPELNVARNHSGKLNLAELLPASAAPAKKPPVTKAAAKPFVFEADGINLTKGVVHFSDAVPQTAFDTTLHDINISLKQFSTAANHPAALTASLITDNDATLKNSGKLTVQPFSAEGDLTLHGIPLQYYAPYYANLVLFDTTGTMNAATHYRFSLANGTPQLQLGQLSAQLTDLQLLQRKTRSAFLKIAHLAVDNSALDLGKRSVTLGSISTDQGSVDIRRNRDGIIDLTQLLPAHGSAGPAKGKQAAEKTLAWDIAVNKLALQNYAVNFTDASLPHPAVIKTSAINLTADNFTTRPGNKTNVDLHLFINRTGRLAGKGVLTLDPLSAALSVEARGVDIVPMQPYFAHLINITVTDGAISTKGKLQLAIAPKRPAKVTYIGNARVTGFASVDNQDSEDFLKWDNLELQSLRMATAPQHANIGNVILTGLYSRLIINPDGRLNVQNILKDSAPTTTSVAAAAPAPKQPIPAPAKAGNAPAPSPVTVSKIVFKNGHINFTDHFIQPNYSANLTGLNGAITGLSSDPASKADILLNGKVENQGQLDINGQINPLSGNLYLDLLAKLSDFELSPLTPYSAKYAGYGIQKGKLSFDVKYHIENRKLSAENHLFLNQLTLGDRVESPSATKLPVTLALALLKDRNGNINITLPIAGSLDDPQFSIGSLIIKVILNLLSKAVTSPFALIGSIFGGDSSQLSYLEFAPGSAVIDQAGETKLKDLGKALADRPSLKLDIAGRIDADIDASGLRQLALERLLKVQKLKQIVRSGLSVSSVDDIKIEPNEYANYLKLAYKAEKIPDKPKVMGLIDKDIPPAQMEKLMLANIKVSPDDLRDLALRRAQVAKEYLVQQGAIDAARIFITTAKTETEEQKKLKRSRVDFILGAN
ncbi:hypothetical protein CAP31_01665 [Sulfuriferula sp. AH1]|uniref:DUF748 domain-containing protein n=1 Tax=Sulfuriferula sp. AH1 TaxID=1985873 RepID=UPI000B3B4BE1|nr:DUF748 domain-containing protein [Sulfuriferula sp. AH1]ARU30514.1 hypothetical protein CAP31_01665 [Sulfuriferula sp. AH1]